MSETRTLCLNGSRYFHHFQIEKQYVEVDLLAFLESQDEDVKCYWQGRDGVEIACIGSVLTLSEVPRFERDHDSPAKFWGGHQFFPKGSAKDEIWANFPKLAFFLPKYEIQKKGSELTIISNSINAPLVDKLEVFPTFFEKIQGEKKEAVHFPSRENWMELVKGSLERIQQEAFDKVVMARRSTFSTDLSALEMLSRLSVRGAIRFAFQFKKGKTFVGATPEILFHREGRLLKTEAVAGTRPLGRGSELLKNEKELREFRFVISSIEEALEPLCSEILCGEEHVIQAGSVEHLHAKIDGNLQQDVWDQEILEALHPTAAMGGLPKKSALEHLLSQEPFERGWYASPLGYVSAKETEFAVGIRSALFDENKMHLFAGAGIVQGSMAEKEWEELEHKTALWRNL